MKKFIFSLLFFIFFSALLSPAFSQSEISELPKQEFYKSEVLEIKEQGEKEVLEEKTPYQILEVKILEGPEKGKTVEVEHGEETRITRDQLLTPGDTIIVSKTAFGESVQYRIYDSFRLNNLLFLLTLFFIAVVIVAGKKGVGSILGMIVSLAVIILFILPNILKGGDPLTITIVGAILIIFPSTYLAHGVSKKTTIAVFSTLFTLFITAIFSAMAIDASSITGLGDEDYFSLQMGPTSIINIKGLFLSAIIISTLGALNDITTTQSATIYELKKANPKLKFIDLFKKGTNIGKEHIASLVNTLVLAYVGSAFAVFIFLVLNPTNLPYWVIINNEIVSGEIVKILAASMGLLLSVPIVTSLASYIFANED